MAPRLPQPAAAIIGRHDEQLEEEDDPAPDVGGAAEFRQQPLARHQFTLEGQKGGGGGDPFRMPAPAFPKRNAFRHASEFIHKKTDKPKEPDIIIYALRQTTRTMKKRLIFLPVLAGLLCLAASGCSNKNIDTAKVREAFQSVSGDAKEQLEEALKDIEASNYVAAVKPLRTVAYTVRMDANQRKVLEEMMKKLRAKVAAQK